MASSASEQGEPNRALWLAIRVGKMELSFPLGTTRCIPQAKFHQKPYNISFIDQVFSVKMAGYWPRSVFASIWTSTSSRSINTQIKQQLGQYPAILTERTWSITNIFREFPLCLRPCSFPEPPAPLSRAAGRLALVKESPVSQNHFFRGTGYILEI